MLITPAREKAVSISFLPCQMPVSRDVKHVGAGPMPVVHHCCDFKLACVFFGHVEKISRCHKNERFPVLNKTDEFDYDLAEILRNLCTILWMRTCHLNNASSPAQHK